MKEITRIHIAKIAYDIELDAKKEIQKYINALERYAEDTETLDDIEIRITELLAERGVLAGGVIAKDDVAAVRAQLGEPSDFAPEGAGDMAVGVETMDDSSRKLYRDQDSAILGGVLAGVARFFRIDPIWVRLIFIVLFFGSVGTAGIVYLILWLVVPPARTAAEKLQMRGQAVTLEGIKQIGEQDSAGHATAETARQIIRFGAGTLLLIGAIGALIATAWVTLGLSLGTTDNSPIASWRPTESWWLMLALGLFVLAGLLLSALGFILADATFRKRWSRRIGVSVVAIITAGILSFAGGLSTLWYGSWQENIHFNELRKTSSVNLPAGFKQIKTLAITGDGQSYSSMNIEYIVSDKLRYELDALPGVKPQVTIGDDGVSATISLTLTEGQTRWYWTNSQPWLKIYGPALETVTVKNNTLHYYNESVQDALTINGDSGQFTLAGSYKAVRVENKETATVTLSNATIESLAVQLKGGYVDAGVVRTLTVQAPEACPAREPMSDLARVHVQAVSSGTLTFNGTERPVRSANTNCGMVSIGLKDYDNEEDE